MTSRDQMRFLVFLSLWMPGLFLAAPAARAVEPYTAFTGPQRPLASPMPLEEMGGLHRMDRRTWSESWFHVVRLDSGHTLFITFMVSNISLTPPDAGVEVSLGMPDGTYRFIKSLYDEKDLSLAKDAFSIRIGPNRVWGTHPGYRIEVHEKGIDLELAIQSCCPGIRFRNGRVILGKKGQHVFDHSTHVPSSRVEGTLGTGGTPIPVQGWLHADHCYQDLPSSAFSSRWRSLRFFQGDVGLVYVEFDLTAEYGGAPLPWLYLIEDNKVRCFTNQVRFTEQDPVTDPATGYAYPRGFTLEVSDPACPLRCAYTARGMVDRLRITDHLGLVQRTILKTFIADPVFYRFLDSVDLTLEPQGRNRRVTGEGVHEYIVVGNE
jgi:hypothetical protein